MIEPIPGWSCAFRADGVVLVPPEGEALGTIRYVERLRPLRSICEIARTLPAPPDHRVRSVSPVERLVTVEGEHAALAVVDAEQGGAPVAHAVGVVFADDFYSLVVGSVRQPAQRERFRGLVRDLVRHDTHMLGVRRRRFVHAAPAGWHGTFAGAMHVHWVPVDYPRNASSLSVFPALPSAGASNLAESLVEHAVRNAADPGALGDAQAVTSAAGLSGRWWSLDVRGSVPALHDFVVLEDERYAYPLVMQSPLRHHAVNRELLFRVVDSVEPIPGGGVSHALAASLFAHWVH